jgi:formamidopyrimidine-DNA glycosylase
MPELPEVETTRRGIAPHIQGEQIIHLEVRNRHLRWPVPKNLGTKIIDQRILSVDRRAKYLLFQLANGFFTVHLGMSGSLRLTPLDEALRKHDHVVLNLSNNLSLRLNDPRRFGCVLWLGKTPYQHALLNALGPEPFAAEFNGDYMHALSRKRKIAIKNFIMDNHIVVGVGNIYANEALFLSGIRPRTAAGRVTGPRYRQLADNIQKVLSDSIEMGGTTLRDFVGGDGKPGYFQQTLRVYGRAGKPCLTCSTAIKQVVIGQRSSYYCPTCQR